MRRPSAFLRALLFASVAWSPWAVAQNCAGFTDVDAADPFCPSIEWVRNRSVTQGCTPTLYCPPAAVTRDQLAAFLQRFGTTMAAMQWVDGNDTFIGRAGPGYTLETTLAGQRVLVAMAPAAPAGYVPHYATQFEYEGPNCSGRRYFMPGDGNTGARTLAVVLAPVMGVHYAYVSGPANPLPWIASRGDVSGGSLVCTDVPSPGYGAPRHEATGPYVLPSIAFPLYLR